ncbi:sortilin-related receptor [Elysia marginata]|uniref:Sortilin-related receptor n=1 Tax=Elysia marginata TaxID=1093978 RepID=A0AAV4HVG5_9GAST|nr:sortilin-related receptor [Elysia marginata]
MQLWISHKGDSFSKAEFPNWHNITDVYVADASEGQLMVCVSHNSTYTNLYISDVNSYKFSLSYAKKPFADVTKVSGVGGIYIASQQVGSSLSLTEQISLISYDKGAVWQRIVPPTYAINGLPSQCKKNCSLHLTQMFHQLHPASKFAPILSQKSAPGLVVASGVLGSNLEGNPDVFVSTSAGISWKIALSGPYLYATADQGGIIAAIHLQRTTTKELLYSIDDGDTWQSYVFSDTDMRVYGLLTEPGENTTVFTVFGSPVSHHSWTIIQVDMKDVFDGKKCQESDYKMWSVQDEFSATKEDGCLLGRITQYQRRDAKAKCYNGKDFVRESIESNCQCKREDFECDYGYKKSSFSSTLCERDHNVPNRQIHQIPEHCAPGTYYKYTRGYRKVPGDSCEGGLEHGLSPLQYACPVKKRPAFLLLTSGANISRLDLGSGRTTYLLGMTYAVTVAAVFDWEKNALIFVDADQLVKRLVVVVVVVEVVVVVITVVVVVVVVVISVAVA